MGKEESSDDLNRLRVLQSEQEADLIRGVKRRKKWLKQTAEGGMTWTTKGGMESEESLSHRHKHRPYPDRKSHGTPLEKLTKMERRTKKKQNERVTERGSRGRPSGGANSKSGSICPLHLSQEEHLK